jgi:hypothetical protein
MCVAAADVAAGKWRGLEVAVKTVLFTEKSVAQGGVGPRRGDRLPQQSALLEVSGQGSALICT